MPTHTWQEVRAKMSPDRQARLEERARELIAEIEAENRSRKTLVFAFGRFNPPTRGHEALIRGLAKKASLVKGDLMLFVSGSTDASRNPLTHAEKVAIIRKTFPKLAIGPVTVKNPPEALTWAQKNGYGAATMLLGDDGDQSYEQYKSMIATWQRTQDPESLMTIDVGTIPRQGDMDPDKISGTRARELARRGDFEGLRPVMMSGMTDKMLHDVVSVIQTRLGPLTEEEMSDEQYDKLVMETIDALFEEDDDDAASDMTPDITDVDVDGDPDDTSEGPAIDVTDPHDRSFSSVVFHPKSYLKFRIAQRAAAKRAEKAAPTYKSAGKTPAESE